MARTPSNMIPLGSKAPTFSLPDTVSGKNVSFEELASPWGTVVMFICNHCPFVVHLAPELSKFAREFTEQGASFIAISSNDVENYPQDGPELMKENAKANDYCFPYLYDETQQVAKAYDAACTPDFYIYDGDHKLVYRGQFDSSRPGNGVPVTGEDMRNALEKLKNGEPQEANQKPSIGCNIKWKS